MDTNDEGDANRRDDASERFDDAMTADATAQAGGREASAPRFDRGGRRGVRELAVVAILCLAVGWFHAWTVWSTGKPLRVGPEQRDYYNLLIDGWLDGQLHLKTEVPAALRALDDPYDPAKRPPGVGLHDASLYRGKYYVYFGVAPVVTLMLPFRVVMGMDLPLHLAVLAFVYGGFLASVALLLAVRRRYFPEAGLAVVGAAVVVLGLTALGPVLLRRPDMWELPIAGGYCFAMLTLGAVWRSVHAEDGVKRARWLAAAGLLLGLAVASRPTYLFAMPLLVVPVVGWWWMRRKFPWREAMHGVVPLALVGAAMAWHNYARFENPLQFGQAYQLSLDYESKLPHFQARYVPYNVKQHFLDAARWERYFPFVRPAEIAPAPAGYTMHRGDVYGVLTNMPVLWLALAAPLALRRRGGEARRQAGIWLATGFVLLGATAGVMCLFFSALARYQLEFVPTLTLLASVGVVAVGHELGGLRRGARIAGRLVLTLVALWSGVFGVLYSLQVDGLLKEQDPKLRDDVARTLNWVPATIERLAGVKHGAIEMRVRLSAERRTGDDTLLRCGEGAEEDRVFLRYEGSGTVRIGLQHGAAPARMSEPLTWPRDEPQRVWLAMGSLCPPATHPYFRGWSVNAVQRERRYFRVEVNEKSVLEGHYRFANAGRVKIGADAGFSGVVDAVQRGAMEKHKLVGRVASFAPTVEAMRFRVSLPQGRAGHREPLVVTGQTGAGDFLFVEYVDASTVRIGFDHWGAPGIASEPLRLNFAKDHTIDVAMGSLATVPNADNVPSWRSGRLRVAVNGAAVLEAESEFYTAEPGEVWFGLNPLGGTSCEGKFSGEIRGVEPSGR